MKQQITENEENLFFGDNCPGVRSDLNYRFILIGKNRLLIDSPITEITIKRALIYPFAEEFQTNIV